MEANEGEGEGKKGGRGRWVEAKEGEGRGKGWGRKVQGRRKRVERGRERKEGVEGRRRELEQEGGTTEVRRLGQGGKAGGTQKGRKKTR